MQTIFPKEYLSQVLLVREESSSIGTEYNRNSSSSRQFIHDLTLALAIEPRAEQGSIADPSIYPSARVSFHRRRFQLLGQEKSASTRDLRR